VGRRVIKSACTHTFKLVSKCVSYNVLTWKSVWVDSVSAKKVNVGKVVSKSSCVQVLTSKSCKVRVLKPQRVEARRITSESGCIEVVKRVHETISETKKRSISCEPYKPSSCKPCGCGK